MFRKRTITHEVTSAEISLDGISIPYTLIKSRASRHARLKVSPENGLSVILPQHYPTSFAEKFIRDKQQWITNKLAMLQNNRQIYADASRVQYLGNTLNIRIQATSDSAAIVRLNGNDLDVCLPTGFTEARQVVDAWLKTRARDIILPLTEQLSLRLNAHYSSVHIRTAKTRWGSCSPRGALNLNWKLVMLPQDIIEYVIIHELCHLREMNHSPAFWRLVEQYCPNWRACRRWLKRNDSVLVY
ncbi:MAG: M48 family metallopeptidase [Dehalococcoidia bacterium]|nr:M48 family metallopeptidase [Dehalococcoidia bacterium]